MISLLFVCISIVCAVADTDVHTFIYGVDEPVPEYVTAGRWIIIELVDVDEIVTSVTWAHVNATGDPNVLYPSADGIMRVRRPRDNRRLVLINPVHVSLDSGVPFTIVIEGTISSSPNVQKQVVQFNMGNEAAATPEQKIVAVESRPSTTLKIVTATPVSTQHEHAHHPWVGVLVVILVGMGCVGVAAILLRMKKKRIATSNRPEGGGGGGGGGIYSMADVDFLASLGNGADEVFKKNMGV